MKRIFGIAVSFMFMSAPVFAQNGTDELPQRSSDFIDEHFSNERIEEVDVDDSWYNLSDSETYEVRFENGIELDFNSEGEITEIESEDGQPIPRSVLPEKVRDHLDRKAANANVVNWEKDDDGHEIELENGEEYEFDRNGQSKDKSEMKDKKDKNKDHRRSDY